MAKLNAIHRLLTRYRILPPYHITAVRDIMSPCLLICIEISSDIQSKY